MPRRGCALVQDHAPQEVVLRRDGVVGRLPSVQKLIAQARRILEAAICQLGGDAVQVGLPQVALG